MGSAWPGLRFEGYEALAGRPNVVVDGSPCEGTVLCLSHWPGIGSPSALAADTSAEMALLYVGVGAGAGDGAGASAAGAGHGDAALVSNNHFDQDGLVGLFALVAPDEALARRAFLEDVARAGDFGTYRLREAARVSMAIATFGHPEHSPLGALPTDYGAMTVLLYDELLGRLAEMCDHPERFGALWEEEDASLAASEAAVAGGGVLIDEVPELDLAVVTVPVDGPDGGGHRFVAQWETGLHPMSLHNATARGALLVIRGASVRFTYRYESWVQYRSRVVRARVDLAPLAELLTSEEPGSGTWVAGGVSGLTPTLSLSGAEGSGLAPERVRSLVEAHLRAAPAAWDPYLITR